MELSIALQTLIFLKAALLGLGLGILYDLLRAVRHMIRAGVLATALCDCLFWLFALLAGFIFVLEAASGEGRGYILLGVFLGALLYFIAFSPPVFCVLTLVLQGLASVFRVAAGIFHHCFLFYGRIFTSLQKYLRNVKKTFHFAQKRGKIK